MRSACQTSKISFASSSSSVASDRQREQKGERSYWSPESGDCLVVCRVQREVARDMLGVLEDGCAGTVGLTAGSIRSYAVIMNIWKAIRYLDSERQGCCDIAGS